PPNTDISQKNYISIWMEDKAIGVLDLIEGYPEKTSVWISLLLVHGSLHSKKIGGSIVNAVLTSAKKVGYRSIQLGVNESNVRGLAFWERYGFNVFRQNQSVVIMAKRIV
ncbi:GNAT family N-acetyltransferase, partial [Ruminococcaceae bacterium OttesenSCG-928-D13]|nr:GNAT family N-acetyltransferase [Ruminococcaceae bacterium OttesenSCG-928-D13]